MSIEQVVNAVDTAIHKLAHIENLYRHNNNNNSIRTTTKYHKSNLP
jgi:hypothetical protein